MSTHEFTKQMENWFGEMHLNRMEGRPCEVDFYFSTHDEFVSDDNMIHDYLRPFDLKELTRGSLSYEQQISPTLEPDLTPYIQTVEPEPTPYAVPTARTLAKKLDVDLCKVSGTGQGGRILKTDVERHVAKTECAETQAQRSVLKHSSEPLYKKRSHRVNALSRELYNLINYYGVSVNVLEVITWTKEARDGIEKNLHEADVPEHTVRCLLEKFDCLPL